MKLQNVLEHMPEGMSISWFKVVQLSPIVILQIGTKPDDFQGVLDEAIRRLDEIQTEKQ